MAQYQHLNIYKKTFELLVYITKLTVLFQRNYRYTIGEKLNNSCIEEIVLIYKANSARNSDLRCGFILEMLEKLQYINILLNLSKELKNISINQHKELMDITENIEKQLHGWLSSQSRLNNKDE